MSVGRIELSPELVDWLTEAVVLAGDPQLRADRVCAIVEAVVDAIGWRAGDDAASVELQSISVLLQAARAHQSSMRDAARATTDPVPAV